MGKKRVQAPPTPPLSRRRQNGMNPVLIGAVIVVVIGVAVLAFWKPSEEPAAAAAAGEQAAPRGPEPTPEAIAKAEEAARLGPRKQANLPPIPFQGYAPPRPREVITAAYQFAAEHPEVLSYVPCFCGCERAGHTGNTDCFVKERAPNGDVVTWDPHGVECAVCIDVANRSRQMHASGASVRDIRAAIDKEFGPLYQGRMGTPHPPGHNH
jgi:hypothetical protein